MSTPNVTQLHCLLQCALEVELFTIPPYLTALYSLPDGVNREAADILQGVAMEEMLHLGLVANVLNAVGGHPMLDTEASDSLFVQTYPSSIPHIELDRQIQLLPFSEAAIDNFVFIESPDRVEPSPGDGFETIGEFYEKIKRTLIDLCEDYNEEEIFCGDGALQLEPTLGYYGAGGRLIKVSNLNEALTALEIVSEQGEGRRDPGALGNIGILSGDHLRFGQPKDAAHYFRFQQILFRQFYSEEDVVSGDPHGPCFSIDWEVGYPCGGAANDKTVTTAFVAAYRNLLRVLHQAFNGKPDVIIDAIHEMFRVKEEAIRLMRTPALEEGQTITPPFWFVSSRVGQPDPAPESHNRSGALELLTAVD